MFAQNDIIFVVGVETEHKVKFSKVGAGGFLQLMDELLGSIVLTLPGGTLQRNSQTRVVGLQPK